MTMIALINQTFKRQTFVNDAPSNAITNTTTETAFDQFYTLGSANVYTLVEGTTIRIAALGTISTGLLNLGFRLRVRWGGIGGTVIGDTGGITILSSLTNAGWLLHSVITVRDINTPGIIDAEHYAAMQSGTLLAMPSTGTANVDFSIPNDVVITAQWTTASANNSIQCRSFVADVDHP